MKVELQCVEGGVGGRRSKRRKEGGEENIQEKHSREKNWMSVSRCAKTKHSSSFQIFIENLWQENDRLEWTSSYLKQKKKSF